METEINKQAIKEQLFFRKSVTVPYLQTKFSADYRTVRELLREMENDGEIEFKGGLRFVAVPKPSKPQPSKPQSSATEKETLNSFDERFRRFSEELRSREKRLEKNAETLEKLLSELENEAPYRRHFRNRLLHFFRNNQVITLPSLGRRFSLPYSHAARILECMSAMGALDNLGGRYIYKETSEFVRMCDGENPFGNIFNGDDEEDEEDDDDDEDEDDEEEDDENCDNDDKKSGCDDPRDGERPGGDYFGHRASFPKSVVEEMQKEYDERLNHRESNDDSGDEGLLNEKNFRCIENFFGNDNLGKYSYYMSRTIKISEIAGICRKTGRESAARYAEEQYKKSLAKGDDFFAVIYMDAATQFRHFTDEQFREIAGSGN